MKILSLTIYLLSLYSLNAQKEILDTLAVEPSGDYMLVEIEDLGYGIIYKGDTSTFKMVDDMYGGIEKAEFIQLDDDPVYELIYYSHDSNWDSDYPFGGTDWEQEFIFIYNVDTVYEMYSELSYWESLDYYRDYTDEWLALSDSMQKVSDPIEWMTETERYDRYEQRTYTFENGYFLCKLKIWGTEEGEEKEEKYVLKNGRYVLSVQD